MSKRIIASSLSKSSYANALTKAPLKAYVVESDITDTQKKAQRRNAETSF